MEQKTEKLRTLIGKRSQRTFRGLIFFEICDEEVLARHDTEPQFLLSNIIGPFSGTSFHPLKIRFTENKSQIMADIYQVESSFEDPQDRQIRIAKLKKSIRTLMDKLGSESRVLMRVLNMTLDALKNTPSEHLNREHIDAIKFVLDMIDKDVDDNEVNSLQEILIKSGLNPLPKIEGIADLYQ
jgi:Mg2+ and Co2+ transporter CorA